MLMDEMPNTTDIIVRKRWERNIISGMTGTFGGGRQ